MKESQILSIRLDGDALDKLRDLQEGDDSLALTAKRVLLDALGIVNISPQGVNNDSLRELIDIRIDERLAHLLAIQSDHQERIAKLENELEVFKVSSNSPATSSPVTAKATKSGGRSTAKKQVTRSAPTAKV